MPYYRFDTRTLAEVFSLLVLPNRYSVFREYFRYVYDRVPDFVPSTVPPIANNVAWMVMETLVIGKHLITPAQFQPVHPGYLPTPSYHLFCRLVVCRVGDIFLLYGGVDVNLPLYLCDVGNGQAPEEQKPYH
jgi:hypothetical protein